MTPKQIYDAAVGIKEVADGAKKALEVAKQMADTDPDNALLISLNVQAICKANENLSTFVSKQADKLDPTGALAD